MEARAQGTSWSALAKAGAYLLLALSAVAQPLAHRVFTKTYTFYFAATEYTDVGLESLFSPEISWTVVVTNGNWAGLTLAWDRSSDPSVVGYHLYEGMVSGQYTNMWDAGNSNQLSVILVPAPPPPVPLRHFLKVSWKGNGTNIWGSYDLTRPWMPLSYPTNTFTLTNPTGASVYWKATNIVLTNWSAP